MQSSHLGTTSQGLEIGNQSPRVATVPEYETSLGQEAVELAKSAGLVLDPWQQLVLKQALGKRKDGKWAAFEVGVVVSRQNGKGGILEARELAGLFLFEERLQIHSAHQFDTSLEAFRRLLWLIEDMPGSEGKIRRVSRSHGEEGIELMNGCRIRFRTRTKGGGRGFSSDCLYLDEAMILPTSSHGALLPTLSARPNPQVWYTGSAVDQLVHEDGVVLARVRERGLAGNDPSLAYFEWSAVEDLTPEEIDDSVAESSEAWAAANPGLGIRIAAEHIENERRSMDARTFAVERLGIGDWPVTDGSDSVIDPEQWRSLVDPKSKLKDPVCLAFDVTPARTFTTIGAAGLNHEGKMHVEVVDRRRGTGWVVERLVELYAQHNPAAILCDGASPAASLVHEIEEALGIEIQTLTAQEHGKGCGLLVDLVEQEELRHLGTPELNVAVKGAARRPLGDAWAWSRKTSAVDISPLVACTLALWGAATAVAPPDLEPMFAWT